MKVLSIIGTRPQYIKVKPIFDEANKRKIEHIIVDTNQHYSHNVSQSIIESLGLQIDHNLNIENSNEIDFIKDCISELQILLKKHEPDYIFVYGDTNSTFCGSLVAYKLGIPLAHIESGLRCGDVSVPEEVNRIFSDTVSDFKFCSTTEACERVGDGIYIGDLEYELLNSLEFKLEKKDFAVMTIHRQENMSKERLTEIFEFCKSLNTDIKFYIHHRTKFALDKEEIVLPSNIIKLEPCNFIEMTESLSKCKYILTDSGGLQKTAPFFGKKALIFRKETEWSGTMDAGYCSFFEPIKSKDWLERESPPRTKYFFINQALISRMPSAKIFDIILGNYHERNYDNNKFV